MLCMRTVWPLARGAAQTAQRWHVFTPSLIYALSSAEPWLSLLFLFLPSFLPAFPPPPTSISFISLLIGILPFAPVSPPISLFGFFSLHFYSTSGLSGTENTPDACTTPQTER